MTTELIVSTSSIGVYLKCGYRYLLSSVWRLPESPNIEMAIGTAVHAGVEAMHKGAPDALGAMETALGHELESVHVFDNVSPARAFNESTALLEMYRKNIAPGFHPTIIEQDFLIRVDGTLVSGRIDAADDDVHDTKTTASLSKFRPDRHRLQMTIYRHGFRSITGRWPGRLILDVLARNGRWKQVEVQPDDREMQAAVTLASRGIMEGSFEPTGASNGSCARCPFAGGVCTYARLD